MVSNLDKADDLYTFPIRPVSVNLDFWNLEILSAMADEVWWPQDQPTVYLLISQAVGVAVAVTVAL